MVFPSRSKAIPKQNLADKPAWPPPVKGIGLLALLLTPLLAPAGARAVSGFTGSFDPDATISNWNWSGTPRYTSYPSQLSCAAAWPLSPATDIQCLNLGASKLSASMGARNDMTTSANAVAAIWTWANPSASTSYNVSFSLDYTATSSMPALSGAVRIGAWVSPTYMANITGLALSGSVAPGETLSFRLEVPAGLSTSAVYENYFNINSFNGQAAVPAPVPALGAASAFSFSRRLRRRRNEASIPEAVGSAPPHPSSYLSSALALPEDALTRLPVSFDYGLQGISPPPRRGGKTRACEAKEHCPSNGLGGDNAA